MLPFDASGVREFLDGTRREATWFRRDGDKIIVTGVQTLRNRTYAGRATPRGLPSSASLESSETSGSALKAPAGRLRRAVGAVFVGWLVLVAVTYVIRDRVIGRPLAQIERTVRGSTGDGRGLPSHDLDGLVGRGRWHDLEPDPTAAVEGAGIREGNGAGDPSSQSSETLRRASPTRSRTRLPDCGRRSKRFGTTRTLARARGRRSSSR